MSEFLNKAQLLKSEGKYLKSLSMLGMAASENQYDYTVYYAMGKLYYLMEDRAAAVKYYLISLHMHIIDIIDSEQKQAADVMLMDLPDKTKKLLNKMNEHARYILTDINTPRHIAHAFIDIGQNIMDNEYIEQYRISISGNDEQSELKEREFDFYYMLGIDFCINAMDFSLNRKDVLQYYTGKNDDDMEMLFNNVYNQFINKAQTEDHDSNNS